MRWYDYVVCVWLADGIAAGLINTHWILLVVSLVTYLLYENMRREQVKL
jgi:hypothetical protein